MIRTELTIDEESTLDFISLVEEPAIEVDFFYFNKQNKAVAPKVLQFKQTDEEQRIITGPAMIPLQDIPRVTDDGEVFLVYFSEETVRKCAELFFKNSDPTKTNIDHSEEVVEGITVYESWLVDSANGKGGGKNFETAASGTWMVSYKIDNDDIWNEFIKTGKVKGFSIEGKNFKTGKINDTEEELFEMIGELLKNKKMTETEIYSEIQKKLKAM